MRHKCLPATTADATIARMETRDISGAKRPGPVPGPPTRKYNILLDEALAEWAKRQSGGLSELLRRLLKEEQKRREETSGA